MSTIRQKKRYVSKSLKTLYRENHRCHFPGCDKKVSPAVWGCPRHWFMLPKHLRDRIWATFEPGQEITKTPSKEYVAAVKAVEEWIHAQAG